MLCIFFEYSSMQLFIINYILLYIIYVLYNYILVYRYIVVQVYFIFHR